MESQEVVVRDFALDDLERVKEIHENSGLDYKFPDLTSSLFLVTKVVEVGGIIRAAGSAYVQVECYLFMDKAEWGTPEEKLATIRLLDREVLHSAWLQGVDCACLWLPPGMERFGERLEEMGWSADRSGWRTFSKRTR